jgi:transposase InsO family protein
MKCQFMAEHQRDYPVTTMCRALEVSVSGYYAWRKREPSQHYREDAELADKICVVFQSNRCVYGSPRIHAELHAQGLHCARKRVARLMRERELVAKRPRHRTVTTKSEEGAAIAVMATYHIRLKKWHLGFHRPPLSGGQVGLSHRNCRGKVIMDQRNHACLGSRP